MQEPESDRIAAAHHTSRSTSGCPLAAIESLMNLPDSLRPGIRLKKLLYHFDFFESVRNPNLFSRFYPLGCAPGGACNQVRCFFR